jgi:hypothetical protein
MTVQGDYAAGGGEFASPHATPTLSGFTAVWHEHDGNTLGNVARRMNWIATGW